MMRSLHVFGIIGLGALAVGLGACLPVPNYTFISPPVMGKIHRDGRPVEGAAVYLEHPRDENCAFESDVVTKTNSGGEFSFQPRKELQFFLVMDPIYNWQVCIVDGERRYQGWYTNGIGRLAGVGGHPKEIGLDCNLESKPHVEQVGNSLSKTMGVCVEPT